MSPVALADSKAGAVALLDALASATGYEANLVANDHAQLGTNYNWTQAVYDAVNQLLGSASFKVSAGGVQINSDNLMPVNPARMYRASYWAKASTFVAGTHAYLGVWPYDYDGQSITSEKVMWLPNTLTTLAADLHAGDTTITLTSAANWYNGPTVYQRAMLVWDYRDGSGRLWAPNTYSRHHSGYGAWNAGGINGNVITLAAPWVGFGSTIPAGTPVSDASAGGTYMYSCGANVVIPATWTQFEGFIAGGYDTTGTAPANQWWPGTTQAKMLLLLNRDTTGNVTNFTDVVLQASVPPGRVALSDARIGKVALSDARIGKIVLADVGVGRVALTDVRAD